MFVTKTRQPSLVNRVAPDFPWYFGAHLCPSKDCGADVAVGVSGEADSFMSRPHQHALTLWEQGASWFAVLLGDAVWAKQENEIP